jgi:hypothetical protein
MTTVDINITDPATGDPWDTDELRALAIRYDRDGHHGAAVYVFMLADAITVAGLDQPVFPPAAAAGAPGTAGPR